MDMTSKEKQGALGRSLRKRLDRDAYRIIEPKRDRETRCAMKIQKAWRRFYVFFILIDLLESQDFQILP